MTISARRAEARRTFSGSDMNTTRFLAALLAVLASLVPALAGPGDVPPRRQDVDAHDLARIRAVTAPATDFTKPEKFEENPGGAGTVRKRVNASILSEPVANLTFEQESTFKLGDAFFRKIWTPAPASTQGSDGLGPLFNARACQNCHLKDGRGHPPLTPEEDPVSLFLRLSVPPKTAEQRRAIADHEVLLYGDPTYGTQFQTFAVTGLAAEGRMRVTYADRRVTLDDGTVVHLHAPHYAVIDLAYGPMGDDVMMSPRMAQAMTGLGLIADVPAPDILANADPDDIDGDGISGRPNWVPDPENGGVALGRFGWKAGEPSIRAQAAGAFAGDIGISTPLHDTPHGDCTSAEAACLAMPTGEQARLGRTEAPDPILDLVDFYASNLGVPARRSIDDSKVLHGKALFYGAGRTTCHTPKFVTSREAKTEAHRFQLIWPYSDMLLHDMGAGLADHRPEGVATGSEWRTPPLWGIGLTRVVGGHTRFLHDGRAHSLIEAILWHDGEARAARDAVAAMDASDRADLIRFLESL